MNSSHLSWLRVERLELPRRPSRQVELLQRVLGPAVVGVELQQTAARPLIARCSSSALSSKSTPSFCSTWIFRAASSINSTCRSTDVGQLLPLLGPLVERLELLQRLQVARIVLQDLAPQLHRHLGPLELRRGQLSDLQVGRGALGVVDRADRSRFFYTPISLSQSRRRSYIPLRCSMASALVGIQLDHLLVGLDRLGLVGEALDEQVGDAAPDLRPSPRRRRWPRPSS